MVIKKYFINGALLSLLILISLACTDNTGSNQTISLTPTHTVVFIDKSLSVKIDDTQKKEFIEDMKQETAKSLDAKGSTWTIYFIHGNTGVKSFYTVEQNAVYVSPESGGYFAVILAKEKYERAKRNIKEACNKKMEEALNLQNTDATKNGTDLWGTFEVCSRVFSKCTSGAEKKVIYFSDMVESMPGKDRRNFHKNKLGDLQTAESFAKKDIATIRKMYKIEPNQIEDAEFLIYTVTTPTAKNHNNYLRYYWEGIFDGFGIDKYSM